MNEGSVGVRRARLAPLAGALMVVGLLAGCGSERAADAANAPSGSPGARLPSDLSVATPSAPPSFPTTAPSRR
ncbi:hypothetical protein [Streptomyces sp. SAJ15]|uniref:hypothetical protein n=1 Tax=Streptomyces sp. SAJ15 TaxID=2011095 RepID=UPI001185D7B8|nr:hypothetical protein [Streptomyces sp. SAJ15]